MPPEHVTDTKIPKFSKDIYEAELKATHELLGALVLSEKELTRTVKDGGLGQLSKDGKEIVQSLTAYFLSRQHDIQGEFEKEDMDLAALELNVDDTDQNDDDESEVSMAAGVAELAAYPEDGLESVLRKAYSSLKNAVTKATEEECEEITDSDLSKLLQFMSRRI